MNALPQLAAATVNCRVLPEDSPQYVQESLRKAIADDQVSLQVIGDPEQGPASPLRPDVLEATTRVTTKLWPGVQVVPNMVMGATDGRSLRIAGIPTYGVQGIFIDRDDIRFHGRDERIYVQSFYEGQAFLYDLVKELSSSRN
jgi:acetylornithine deacetylase/succinyl-diaminopimelate desuccinylase-like protein